MRNFILGIVIIALIFFGVMYGIKTDTIENPLGGVNEQVTVVSTSTAKTVTAVSSLVLSANPNCKERDFTFSAGTNSSTTIYLSGVYATSTYGIALSSSTKIGKHWPDSGVLYCGDVYGVTNSGSATLSIHELSR